VAKNTAPRRTGIRQLPYPWLFLSRRAVCKRRALRYHRPMPRQEPAMSDHLTIIDHPLVQHKLTLMRDKTTPSGQFRLLLREISHFLTYEATRDLPLTSRTIETPMTGMDAPVLKGKKLALVSILRAGNGMLDGVLDGVPLARVGFVGLYRDEATLKPVQYYCKLPEGMEDRVSIVVDPMLATGNSSAAAVDLIKQAGAQDIRFLCLLAAPEGIARMQEAHPDVPIVTASVDDRLDDHGYIVPGLGDAGDRMFGTK
jgi:uracil phosphoribosyltransferase